MTEALLLIDIQNIYFTPGKYLLDKPEIAAQNAALLLDKFRKDNKPIIHVKHDFKVNENYDYLNAIHDSVKPLPNEFIVHKNFPNSFLNTTLLSEIKKLNVNKLVIAEMMSHMCIDTTVRACQNYQLKATLIFDACTTKDLCINGNTIPANVIHNSFMAALNGMFANVIYTKDYLG